MKKLFASFITIGLLSGCSWMPFVDDEPEEPPVVTAPEPINPYAGLTPSVANSAKFRDDYQQLLLKNHYLQQKGAYESWRHEPELPQNINFYMRGMMQDLVGNLQYVNETTPIAVTSFPLLDSDLTETNVLGNQIAESLMHEAHKVGIPVIDFKTKSAIDVEKSGDYIFSRNQKQLEKDLPIRYILSGTIVKHQGGYLVNARMIGINSKAVVGSAQSYIPANAANAIKNQRTIDLVKG